MAKEKQNPKEQQSHPVDVGPYVAQLWKIGKDVDFIVAKVPEGAQDHCSLCNQRIKKKEELVEL